MAAAGSPDWAAIRPPRASRWRASGSAARAVSIARRAPAGSPRCKAASAGTRLAGGWFTRGSLLRLGDIEGDGAPFALAERPGTVPDRGWEEDEASRFRFDQPDRRQAETELAR